MEKLKAEMEKSKLGTTEHAYIKKSIDSLFSFIQTMDQYYRYSENDPLPSSANRLAEQRQWDHVIWHLFEGARLFRLWKLHQWSLSLPGFAEYNYGATSVGLSFSSAFDRLCNPLPTNAAQFRDTSLGQSICNEIQHELSTITETENNRERLDDMSLDLHD